jgi:ABC-type nickel/cobalt efflux system permease component RcnA
LTPGHGKAALATYFVGQDANIATGVRVTLAAAFLHVVSGALVFLVLRFVMSPVSMVTGRGSPFFTVTGYGLIMFAGALMLAQSLRAAPGTSHPHALVLGVGLLPCPLTITVLGFAWAQTAGPMVLLVLIALAAGIAFVIGTVALVSIVLRHMVGQVLARHMSALERGSRVLQGVAGAAIVVIAGYSLWMAV